MVEVSDRERERRTKVRSKTCENHFYRQIAIADVILVNKIDLVSDEDKAKLLALIRYVPSEDPHSSTIFSLIRSINVTAQIYETIRSQSD